MGLKNGTFWIKNNLKEMDPIMIELKTHSKEDVASGLQFIFEEIIVEFIKIQMKSHGKNIYRLLKII